MATFDSFTGPTYQKVDPKEVETFYGHFFFPVQCKTIAVLSILAITYGGELL